MFSLTLSSSPYPTEPYYTIDFVDKTPIALPKLIYGLTETITYTYKYSGVHNVVITVFNKVSSSTFNFTVLFVYLFE